MANFGLFRGFSEKLFEGELPTSLGNIGSQSVSDIDPEVLAFFARVDSAGGILSTTEQNAIEALVQQIKNDGIWTKIKAIYPYVGASAAACAQNLKSSSFTGVFYGGWTFASTGVTPNGTNAYFDTQLKPSTALTAFNTSIGVYNRIPVDAPAPFVPIGIADPTNNPCMFLRYYTNVWQSFQNSETTRGQIQVSWGVNSWSDIKGFWQSSRTTSQLHKVFRNGASIATSTQTETSDITQLNFNIYVAARNRNVGIDGFDKVAKSFAFIADGLNDTESLAFYNAVQAFQTTLSRQV
jgi:hypothetical protein